MPAPMSATARLWKAVEAAQEQIAAEATTDEALVALHQAIDGAVIQLAQLRDNIAARVGPKLPETGKVLGPRYARGYRNFSRHSWQHDALRRTVLAKGVEHAQAETQVRDAATGEKVATWEQAIEWVTTFWPLGGNDVKLTPLKAYGIQANEFSQSSNGPWKLDVKGGGE